MPRFLASSHRHALLALASSASFYAVMRASVRGLLPPLASMVLVTATFVGMLAALVPLADRLNVSRGANGRLLRPGFVVVGSLSAIWLPTLGTFGLIDPWETHYAEVARELVQRGDFISPWWAHEGWFRSKPILLFWLEAIAMRVFGAHTAPGSVLGVSGLERPEWAIRFPIFVFALVAAYVVYRVVAKTSTARRGVLTALVLGTMPHWLLVARQSITDMPYVAAVTVAVGFLILAADTPEDEVLRGARFGIGSRSFTLDASGWLRLVVLTIVVPQCAYLVSRNVDFVWAEGAHGFAWHADLVRAGSPGNLGLPGQPSDVVSALHWPRVEPTAQAILWASLLVTLVLTLGRETRTRRILVLFAWVAASVATMAKGVVGIVLPAAVFVGFALSTGRASLLASSEVLRGLLAFLVIVGPWYLASYARHGNAFWDELVQRHMIGRTLEHLHDTNEGDDVSIRYYVAQLGYGTFPWIALVPRAVARAVGDPRGSTEAHDRGDDTARMGLLFALAAFALVSIMKTKFHHYVLPVIPGLAILVGRELDALFDAPVAALAATEVRTRRRGSSAGFYVFGACLALLVGVDLTTRAIGGSEEGQARLLHLFTYLYRRPFPVNVDLRAPILVTAGACFFLAIACNVHKFRKAAGVGFVVTTTAFALFLADIYLPKLAPHWGQRELVESFVRLRDNPDEPLVAYAMNWKGENFYTGNHVAIFSVQASTPGDAALFEFVEKRASRDDGTRRTYIVAEHGRLASLRKALEVRGRAVELSAFARVTDEALNNKFCLVEARFTPRVPVAHSAR